MYIPRGAERQENPQTYIELKENGLGFWRMLDEEASFRWDVKDSEIRLHTKLGGVIIGTIYGDIIELGLPTQKIKYFKKRDDG